MNPTKQPDNPSHPRPSHPQCGATLIVSLVMLLLITITGFASIRGTILEERMAGNMRDVDIALQAAEAGLNEAESYIQASVSAIGGFSRDCTNGLCTSRDFNDLLHRWEDPTYCNGDGLFDPDCTLPIEAGNDLNNVARPPRYIVEHIADLATDENTRNVSSGYGDDIGGGDVSVFRITVQGFGGSEAATRLIQSTYGKRL